MSNIKSDIIFWACLQGSLSLIKWLENRLDYDDWTFIHLAIVLSMKSYECITFIGNKCFHYNKNGEYS